MTSDRWTRLADLAVHAANVQPGQIMAVSAELEQDELARAIAAAAYRRGAQFVDIWYFDPYLKRARVENADPETLEYVPQWYADRMLAHAAAKGARVSLAGPTKPDLLNDLDASLVGKDRLPWLKETGKIVGERSTNWAILPCPHPAWATLVYPDLSEDEAYEKLWRELEHVLRLDEPDPAGAWEERMATLNDSARRLAERRFDAFELRGPGTELTVGMLPDAHVVGGRLHDRGRPPSFPQPADGRGLHDPGSRADVGSRRLDEAARAARRDDHSRVARPLRGGIAVQIDADENVEALRSQLTIDDGALRLGELALVDRQGRIGPLGTVFYDTLLDENAASHIALGNGFPFLVEEADAGRVNTSGTHVDFMIGSPELEVDGVTAGGERVPVLRDGDWQI